MYKIPNLNTMSAFEVNNIIGTAYPVAALPEHYIESTQFKSWHDLFPEETEFHIPDHLYITDFILRSQADLDKLMVDLRLNPKRYVHLSFFGGKNKKYKEPSDSSEIRKAKK